MANRSLTGYALHAVALAASVEDVVTLDRFEGQVTVLIHPGGTDPVYVTNDNTAATVEGPNTRAVWPGYALALRSATSGPTVIRLISVGTPTYSVEGG